MRTTLAAKTARETLLALSLFRTRRVERGNDEKAEVWEPEAQWLLDCIPSPEAKRGI